MLPGRASSILNNLSGEPKLLDKTSVSLSLISNSPSSISPTFALGVELFSVQCLNSKPKSVFTKPVSFSLPPQATNTIATNMNQSPFNFISFFISLF